MEAETNFSQKRSAVEQWLRKKPQDHFARRVDTLEALREPLQSILLEALLPEEQSQWMIGLPSQGILHHQRQLSWFRKIWPMWELTPSWLIALTDRRLLLIRTTSDGQNSRITVIPVQDILYLEYGMILLVSWLSIHWTEHGAAREETLYYNSVSETICLPLIQMLRRSIARSQVNGRIDEKLAGDHQHNRDMLQQLPFKFMNMIPRYGLLDEERICQTLYRPAQWRRLLGSARIMTSPRMVVLGTDAYLLFAEEDLSSKEGSYGLALTFLPLRFVQDIHASQDAKQSYLNIHLDVCQAKTTRDWSLPFPLETQEAIREFADEARLRAR